MLDYLLRNTSQVKHHERRASILRVESRATRRDGPRELMAFRLGNPDHKFLDKKTAFDKHDYLTDKIGLCWHAAIIEQALRRENPHGAEARKPAVYVVPNVADKPIFRRIPHGHHAFKSIVVPDSRR